MRTRNLTKATRCLTGASLLTAMNALFASTVPLGTLTPFTGGDAGEGLDLSGNIIYAFNLGGFGGIETIQGIDFVDASVFDSPEGITTPEDTLEFDYSNANPDGANGADYGLSADDDALESVVNSVWYNSNWAFDMDVVPGTQYQLQLILQESFFPQQGTTQRNFDVSVETATPDTLFWGRKRTARIWMEPTPDSYTPTPSRPPIVPSKWRWTILRRVLTQTQFSLP